MLSLNSISPSLFLALFLLSAVCLTLSCSFNCNNTHALDAFLSDLFHLSSSYWTGKGLASNLCSLITGIYSWSQSPSHYHAYNIPLSYCCDIYILDISARIRVGCLQGQAIGLLFPHSILQSYVNIEQRSSSIFEQAVRFQIATSKDISQFTVGTSLTSSSRWWLIAHIQVRWLFTFYSFHSWGCSACGEKTTLMTFS